VVEDRASVDKLPSEVELDRPNAARVYDYMLGGANNFAADRAFAEQVKVVTGSQVRPSRVNRSFLRRAVGQLINVGITQFLDLGSGIPTVGNVHEIAQRARPGTRVMYVDNEPVAVAYAEHLLADNPDAAIVQADLRDPAAVLGHPAVRELIDFNQPVAVLMLAVLHFVPDEADPAGIVAGYRSAVPAGSYLALSHLAADGHAELRRAADWFQQTGSPMVLRDRAQVAALFTGTDLLDPGLVWASLWRPDGADPELPSPVDSGVYAGIGRIRTA
jgi:hypothetical protein